MRNDAGRRGDLSVAVRDGAFEEKLLGGTVPPKLGLVRVAPGEGASIALEVWAMPVQNYGSFVALIPSPLGIGTVELADGTSVQGFLCEAQALAGARDITHMGGWRNYIASLQKPPSNPAP